MAGAGQPAGETVRDSMRLQLDGNLLVASRLDIERGLADEIANLDDDDILPLPQQQRRRGRAVGSDRYALPVLALGHAFDGPDRALLDRLAVGIDGGEGRFPRISHD